MPMFFEGIDKHLPRPLTMINVSGAFILFLFGLTASIAVFLIEYFSVLVV